MAIFHHSPRKNTVGRVRAVDFPNPNCPCSFLPHTSEVAPFLELTNKFSGARWPQCSFESAETRRPRNPHSVALRFPSPPVLKEVTATRSTSHFVDGSIKLPCFVEQLKFGWDELDGLVRWSPDQRCDFVTASKSRLNRLALPDHRSEAVQQQQRDHFPAFHFPIIMQPYNVAVENSR